MSHLYKMTIVYADGSHESYETSAVPILPTATTKTIVDIEIEKL